MLQEHERLRLQAQQLQAQLAKKDEEGREGNLRLAQLQAALEERTQALEAAQVRYDSRVQDRLAVTSLSARLLSCTCIHWCCAQLLCPFLDACKRTSLCPASVQEELRNANGSKFSREAYLTDLQVGGC